MEAARPAVKNWSVMEEVVSLFLTIDWFALSRLPQGLLSSLRKLYVYATCTVTCEEHGTQGCPDRAGAERVSDACQDGGKERIDHQGGSEAGCAIVGPRRIWNRSQRSHFRHRDGQAKSEGLGQWDRKRVYRSRGDTIQVS